MAKVILCTQLKILKDDFNMLRIMYYLGYTRWLGGAASTLFRQALLMKKCGQQICVVISDYMGNEVREEFQKLFLEENVDVWNATYPISSQTEDIDIVSVIENYDAVKKLIKDYKPDILHSVQLNPTVELVGRELHIPHVMDIYQAIPAFFSLNYLDVFPHYHICDSQLYAGVWSRNLQIESVCIRTVASQTKCRKKINFSRDGLKFVCVGSLEERKNQMEVIKAFHKALQHGIKGSLAFYGYCDGSYGKKCQEYVTNHGLTGRIVFKGFCTDMQSEYENSDVLICGSTNESYPNVISEALASGLIIISTPVAGVPEVIRDGKNGFLSKGFQSDDIFDKLIEFDKVREKGQLNDILNNVYETYQSTHAPDTVTGQLKEYYSDLINTYKNPNFEIQIEEVKKRFADIISVYEDNIHKFTKADVVRKKLWYLYHIHGILMKKKGGFYIWGTGDRAIEAKEMLDVFFPEIEISGFLDSYKTGRYLDYPIEQPKDVLSFEKSIIFVAVENGQTEIVAELEAAGKRCNDDYFILAPRVW